MGTDRGPRGSRQQVQDCYDVANQAILRFIACTKEMHLHEIHVLSAMCSHSWYLLVLHNVCCGYVCETFLSLLISLCLLLVNRLANATFKVRGVIHPSS